LVKLRPLRLIRRHGDPSVTDFLSALVIR
jgi:hypothetical protein